MTFEAGPRRLRPPRPHRRCGGVESQALDMPVATCSTGRIRSGGPRGTANRLRWLGLLIVAWWSGGHAVTAHPPDQEGE